MGFGLVIGFIRHVQLVPTINYNSFANSQTSQFTVARTKSFRSSLVVTRQRLIITKIPLALLHCRLKTQLNCPHTPTPAILLTKLANPPFRCRLSFLRLQLTGLGGSVGRSSCCWSSPAQSSVQTAFLYSLGTDPTENTASNISSIVVSRSVA
jgi:hypothetical protein